MRIAPGRGDAYAEEEDDRKARGPTCFSSEAISMPAREGEQSKVPCMSASTSAALLRIWWRSIRRPDSYASSKFPPVRLFFTKPSLKPFPKWRMVLPIFVWFTARPLRRMHCFQRAGEPIAFITTEGFRDMLLIGRQNRPRLYALNVERPAPITPAENWFTVNERIDSRGKVVEPMQDADVARVIREIQAKGLKHVAVCLLFSFINPAHERQLAAKLEAAGMTVSLSSQILPEFPRVRAGQQRPRSMPRFGRRCRRISKLKLSRGLVTASSVKELRVTQSAGGTLSSIQDASASAAKMVLSGPAGGVMGAVFAAAAAGEQDVISYDMGGTSTDVALILGARRNGRLPARDRWPADWVASV